MKFGEFITQYREEHNLSKRAFALMTGISVQQISKIEKGLGNNKKPMTSTMKTYKKVADAIGLSEIELLYLINDDVKVNPNVTDDTILFPILGDVKAGYDRFTFEDWDEQIEIPSSWLKGREKEEKNGKQTINHHKSE